MKLILIGNLRVATFASNIPTYSDVSKVISWKFDKCACLPAGGGVNISTSARIAILAVVRLETFPLTCLCATNPLFTTTNEKDLLEAVIKAKKKVSSWLTVNLALFMRIEIQIHSKNTIHFLFAVAPPKKLAQIVEGRRVWEFQRDFLKANWFRGV